MILRFVKEGKSLTVTTEQTGTPTNANDLAEAILNIITSDSKRYGIYNYSNQGEATWYDFAKEIFAQADKDILLYPIPTSEYPTPANRPFWSVLDCNLIQETFGIEVLDWKKSLAVCLEKLG